MMIDLPAGSQLVIPLPRGHTMIVSASLKGDTVSLMLHKAEQNMACLSLILDLPGDQQPESTGA